MVALSRRAPKLLRTVAGKSHASRDDHVEDPEATPGPAGMDGADIYAEPISSDEEETIITSQNSPPIVPTSPPKPRTMMLSRTARPLLKENREKQRAARATRIPPPRTGSSYAKTRRGLRAEEEDEEKENRRASSSQSSSGSTKRAADADEVAPIFDTFLFPSSQPKRQKTGYATPNIFAATGTGKQKPRPAVKQQNTYAGNKTGYRDSVPKRMNLGADYDQYKKGEKRNKEKIHTNREEGYAGSAHKRMTLNADYDQYKEGATVKKEEDSELSDSELVPLPGSLIKPKTRRLEPSSQQSTASAPNLDDLAAYRDNPTCTIKADPLDLKEVSSPLSSLPTSPVLESAPPHPRDPLENAADLQQYFQNLPTQGSDDRCPLCDAPVPQKLYWDWWKGKTHTVRQRQFFCHEHQKREAQDKYDKRGYPKIDWKRLPVKIKEHHLRLVAILRNEIDDRPSSYREAHRERMQENERPTVKSLMRHEELLESKTGYYGGRGRRAMMDIITSQLADIIRKCVETDEVVAWGGMANFVQRVLVPELAIELVMQDMQVSEKVAKEVIEESREIGVLVHEEEEDKVHFVDDEDEEDVIDVLDIEV